MTEQILVTLLGRSGWAVVNSYHAIMLETDFRPNRIVLMYEAQFEESVKPVIEGIRVIQEKQKMQPVEKIRIPDFDMLAARDATKQVVETLKKSNSEIALDITGGRKALVSGSLMGFSGVPLKHIFYLTIESTKGAAKPYLMIPKRVQLLRDLKQNLECRKDQIITTGKEWEGFEISKEDLTVILNYAYKKDVSLVIRNPLLNIDLLEIDLPHTEVRMLVDRDTYSKNLVKHTNSDWDYPNYSQLRSSICYSGLVDYRSGDEFRHFFIDEYRRHRNPRSGLGRWYISLDSNLFYNGFVSCLESLMAANQIHKGELLFVTSEGVIQEIDKKISRKYKEAQIDKAKNATSRNARHLFDQFYNRNTLETRIAKMASNQLHLLMEQPTHEKANCDPLPHDSEEADRVIVESLSKFATEKQATVTLLSADLHMEDHCKNAGNLGWFILEPANEIPQVMKASDSEILNLIMSLSVLNGVVTLDKIGHIYGDYGGKKSDNYMSKAKIFFSSVNRAKTLKNQIEKCKKLLDLGIAS